MPRLIPRLSSAERLERGRRVARLMREQDLTLAEAGAAFGVSGSTAWRWMEVIPEAERPYEKMQVVRAGSPRTRAAAPPAPPRPAVATETAVARALAPYVPPEVLLRAVDDSLLAAGRQRLTADEEASIRQRLAVLQERH